MQVCDLDENEGNISGIDPIPFEQSMAPNLRSSPNLARERCVLFDGVPLKPRRHTIMPECIDQR